MDGVINVLKPPGMTSSDVVVWLRRNLKIKKIGHTGTLDPGVPGVLPVCVGKGTRLAEYLTDQGKSYRAEITFGVITDTQDAFGAVLARTKPQITREQFLSIFPRFLGKIKQIPPMFSAVRHQGKHLYKYARAGIDIERSAREVEIYDLKLLYWQDGEFPKALFDVKCSKGTYIRTLCHDMGEVLGCGAYMSYLLRLSSGSFELAKSWTLEEIQVALQRGDTSFLCPLHEVLDLPKAILPAKRVKAFCNGLATSQEQVEGHPEQDGRFVQVLSGGQFLGIGIWRQGALYPHKVLI